LVIQILIYGQRWDGGTIRLLGGGELISSGLEEEVLSGGGGASLAAREDLHRAQQEEDGQLPGLVQYVVQQLDKDMGR
jgi:hypothetical protein